MSETGESDYCGGGVVKKKRDSRRSNVDKQPMQDSREWMIRGLCARDPTGRRSLGSAGQDKRVKWNDSKKRGDERHVAV